MGGRASLGYGEKGRYVLPLTPRWGGTAGRNQNEEQKKPKKQKPKLLRGIQLFTIQEATHFWRKHFAKVEGIYLRSSSHSFKIT